MRNPVGDWCEMIFPFYLLHPTASKRESRARHRPSTFPWHGFSGLA